MKIKMPTQPNPLDPFRLEDYKDYAEYLLEFYQANSMRRENWKFLDPIDEFRLVNRAYEQTEFILKRKLAFDLGLMYFNTKMKCLVWQTIPESMLADRIWKKLREDPKVLTWQEKVDKFREEVFQVFPYKRGLLDPKFS